MIEDARATRGLLDEPARVLVIAAQMQGRFPSLPHLARGPMAERRVIEARIAPRLRLKAEKHRSEAPDTLAPDIAQDLLEREMEYAGKDAEYIANAFRFRERMH